MPIVFDEIDAEIAAPAENSRAGDEAHEAGAAPPPDPLHELRSTLALLHERELRCRAD